MLRTDVTNLPAHEIVNTVAHVPEGRRVFATLTVEENSCWSWQHRANPAGSAPSRGAELFPRLEERRNQLAGTLSGGEQQMLAIGCGLMASEIIALTSHPGPRPQTGAGDLPSSSRSTAAAPPCCWWSRTPAWPEDIRRAVLETGRIALSGPAAELRDDPRVRKAYLGER